MTSKEFRLAKEFENGIYFSCQMCGGCCRGLDAGEVYLYRDGILRLAKHLKISAKKFCRDYVKLVNDSFFWKELGAQKGKNYKYKTLSFRFTGEDEHCYFLKDNKCSVHEASAFQCKCFPLWVQLISNYKNVVNYSKKCPALKMSLEKSGKFYSKEDVLKWAKEEYELEKTFFLEMKRNKFDIFKVYKFLPKDITC